MTITWFPTELPRSRWLALPTLAIALMAFGLFAPPRAAADQDVVFPLGCIRQDAGPPNGGCTVPVPAGRALYDVAIPPYGHVQIAGHWAFGGFCVDAERFYPANSVSGFYTGAQTGQALHNCPGFLGIARDDLAVEGYQYTGTGPAFGWRKNGTAYLYVYLRPDGLGWVDFHWRGLGCIFC